ncbi:hypothetical protein CBS147346_5221 [Aspergillus niger]|nr:hypothetical protein CBS147346_5221 [Aspergillus niger]
MPIPTDGIYFRFLNYQSRNVLVANKGIGESKLTDFNSVDKHYDNQIFELIPRGDGTFYIQSVYVPSSGTKGRIFSISGGVGISFLASDADSTRFTFEEGSGYLAGWYRLNYTVYMKPTSAQILRKLRPSQYKPLQICPLPDFDLGDCIPSSDRANYQR